MKRFILASLAVLLAVQGLPAADATAKFGPIYHHSLVNREGNVVDPHIMGGSLASAGQFPFQVAVYASKFPNSPEQFCGGALISSTAVLTAAHCLHNYLYFDVVLGTLRPLQGGGQTLKTTTVHRHEHFDFDFGLNHDIAVVVLPYPVAETAMIKPIKLPRRSDVNSDFAGRIATTSGWGKKADGPGFVNDDLLYVTIDVIANSVCEAAYGPDFVPPTKMCISTAGGTRGPCHGDSGGPMFLTNSAGEQIVIGVVSYGAKAGCNSGFPDVYTRVTSYLDWIASHGGPPVRP